MWLSIILITIILITLKVFFQFPISLFFYVVIPSSITLLSIRHIVISCKFHLSHHRQHLQQFLLLWQFRIFFYQFLSTGELIFNSCVFVIKKLIFRKPHWIQPCMHCVKCICGILMATIVWFRGIPDMVSDIGFLVFLYQLSYPNVTHWPGTV